VIAVAVSQPKFFEYQRQRNECNSLGTNRHRRRELRVLTATQRDDAFEQLGQPRHQTSRRGRKFAFTNPSLPENSNAISEFAHRELKTRKANHENNISEKSPARISPAPSESQH